MMGKVRVWGEWGGAETCIRTDRGFVGVRGASVFTSAEGADLKGCHALCI